QSVRTRKDADAVRPLIFPVAITVWSPGTAEAGTVTRLAKLPPPSLFALPSFFASNLMTMGSLMPNPLPVILTLVVGGPTVGSSEIDAARGAARAGAALPATAPNMNIIPRVRPAARPRTNVPRHAI